jgi:hypothetical protein
MAILIECDCGHSLRVREELAGRKIRCPKCAKVSTVPQPTVVKDAEDEALDILLAESPGKKAPSRPPLKQPDADKDVRREKPPGSIQPPIPQGPVYRPPPPSKSAPALRSEKPERSRASIAVHPKIITGVLMMVGAVVWFFLGLAANRIFFYPPILFLLGIGAVFRGFKGED